MKTWSAAPLRADVEEVVREFFALLRRGAVEQARQSVQHAFDDWEHQLWSLWHDTWLIALEERDEEVADESFEGGLWRDPAWLASIDIEGGFHWDGDEQSASAGDHLHVGVLCEGVLTDVSAEFEVVAAGAGFGVQRRVIGMR